MQKYLLQVVLTCYYYATAGGARADGKSAVWARTTTKICSENTSADTRQRTQAGKVYTVARNTMTTYGMRPSA